MWMVGYNEGGGDHHHHHHLNMVVDHHPLLDGRNNNNNNKLRPLIPRPMTSSPNYSSTTSTTTTPPCLSRNNIQGSDFFLHYNHHHHHLLVGEEKKNSKTSGSESGSAVVVSSSRWNPTPDQVRALEELYRRGTRTPTAEEIQNITGELRRFGKIEGKNVFYWFQNHKARERQKHRRRQMLESPSPNSIHHRRHDFHPLHHNKESAANRTVHEVEQTKNWALSTNSSTLAEESVSIEREAKAGFAAECRPDGWLQFDESESRNFMERNATWHMLLHCPVTNLINTTLLPPPPPPNAAATIMATTVTTKLMDPNNLIKTRDDLSFFISTQSEEDHENNNNNNNYFVESQTASTTTLQLFPLRSGDVDDNINNKETEISASEMNANNFTPTQFFEFLPLKKN